MDTKSHDFRGLVLALANLLPAHFTFNEIADLFYRGSVNDKPEKPYPGYQGSKADYVKEKLSNSTGNEPFFSLVLPEIFGNIDVEYTENTTRELLRWCKNLGYKVVDQSFEDEENNFYAEWRDLIPPKLNTAEQQMSGAPVSSSFPPQVTALVSQLNDNVKLGNKEAIALISRRLIFVASVLYMKQSQLEERIINSNGDYKELSTILEAVSQAVPDVSVQLLARLRIAKWMGDNANHTIAWRITNEDLVQSLASINQYLRTLFPTK